MKHLISRPWYARWDRYGNEICDTRWLRLGRGWLYVEVGKWGIVARLLVIHFSLHYDPAGD